jgi:hypothetical protein
MVRPFEDAGSEKRQLRARSMVATRVAKRSGSNRRSGFTMSRYSPPALPALLLCARHIRCSIR